jgi:hypothetical protein
MGILITFFASSVSRIDSGSPLVSGPKSKIACSSKLASFIGTFPRVDRPKILSMGNFLRNRLNDSWTCRFTYSL